MIELSPEQENYFAIPFRTDLNGAEQMDEPHELCDDTGETVGEFYPYTYSIDDSSSYFTPSSKRVPFRPVLTDLPA